MEKNPTQVSEPPRAAFEHVPDTNLRVGFFLTFGHVSGRRTMAKSDKVAAVA